MKAAEHFVLAAAPDQEVASRPAVELVVAPAAKQFVVALIADQHVGPGAAGHVIGAGSALKMENLHVIGVYLHRVLVRGDGMQRRGDAEAGVLGARITADVDLEGVDPGAAIDHVGKSADLLRPGIDRVVAGAGFDDVGMIEADNLVGSTACGYRDPVDHADAEAGKVGADSKHRNIDGAGVAAVVGDQVIDACNLVLAATVFLNDAAFRTCYVEGIVAAAAEKVHPFHVERGYVVPVRN